MHLVPKKDICNFHLKIELKRKFQLSLHGFSIVMRNLLFGYLKELNWLSRHTKPTVVLVNTTSLHLILINKLWNISIHFALKATLHEDKRYLLDIFLKWAWTFFCFLWQTNLIWISQKDEKQVEMWNHPWSRVQQKKKECWRI